MENLTPRQIVAELDKYIVGQAPAKRAVAVALRNRYRRQQLAPEVRRDVYPKNLLMIGPTGVGKTEIARRVAKVVDAPFVKVEATKFTEAGYVGQDVETIIFDLIDAGIDMVHGQRMALVQDKAEGLAKDRLIGYLYQQMNNQHGASRQLAARRRGSRRRGAAPDPVIPEGSRPHEEVAPPLFERNQVVEMLEKAQLDDALVEIELSVDPLAYEGFLDTASFTPEDSGAGLDGVGYQYPPPSPKRLRRVPVKEARRLLVRDEANKLVDIDDVIDQALEKVEQSGVVFIDEIDKIAGPRVESGADVSGEGVQRDLLPIVEGSIVMSRYGPVKTDHILFIGAGSFYSSKPSDLIPELQGRFPIRVELAPLTRADFERILKDTDNSLIKQHQALLGTEGVQLRFSEDAISRIAEVAFQVNESTENIGARRLHTVLERVIEDLSFEAPDHAGETIVVDAPFVDRRVNPLLVHDDLARYIL